ncbi:MAG: cytochrome c peroxidase, partial [Bacteroidota bacterium]
PDHMTPIDWGGTAQFDEKATLGRVLFYDKQLSFNNAISCGSCHLPEKGFADKGASSIGFQLQETPRNAQHIANLRDQSMFFWDARSNNLQEQVIMPITNHIEMGINDISQVVQKVQTTPYYDDLFTAAFGSQQVNEDRIAQALSTFLRSLSSHRSKWDKVQEGTMTFSALELQGSQLFQQKRCGSCHAGRNFDGWGGDMAAIGLDENPVDLGLADWTGNDHDVAKFKVPSLRNVEITGPYMHDGRFETLDEVINHYSEDIKPVENLDWRLLDFGQGFFIDEFGNLIPIDLEGESVEVVDLSMTSSEKEAIIAFLKTLTDHELVHDQRFKDPF